MAATRRAADAELRVLREGADFKRLLMGIRNLVDPGERFSRAAEWKAWALEEFDGGKDGATVRNRSRFGDATSLMVMEMPQLAGWEREIPPQAHEAIRAADLLPGIDRGFEAAAAGLRAALESFPSPGGPGPVPPRQPTPPDPSLPGTTPAPPQGREPPRQPPPCGREPKRPGEAGDPPVREPRVVRSVQMPWVARGTPR